MQLHCSVQISSYQSCLHKWTAISKIDDAAVRTRFTNNFVFFITKTIFSLLRSAMYRYYIFKLFGDIICFSYSYIYPSFILFECYVR